METESLNVLRILAYIAVAFAGIVGPLLFLRSRSKQPNPNNSRHTDTTPGPSSQGPRPSR